MNFTKTLIKGLFLIEPKILSDERGFFMRTFCENEFSEVGFTDKWVQTNMSVTSKKGSIRGLHYQTPPYMESKLIRCIRGAVFDVIVDLRKDSESFLKHYAIELSENNHFSLLVPKGCAHGFQTLVDNAQMLYYHTEFYTPKYEAGIKYDDSLVGVQWPLEVTEVSERDRSYPNLTKEFKGL